MCWPLMHEVCHVFRPMSTTNRVANDLMTCSNDMLWGSHKILSDGLCGYLGKLEASNFPRGFMAFISRGSKGEDLKDGASVPQ